LTAAVVSPSAASIQYSTKQASILPPIHKPRSKTGKKTAPTDSADYVYESTSKRTDKNFDRNHSQTSLKPKKKKGGKRQEKTRESHTIEDGVPREVEVAQMTNEIE